MSSEHTLEKAALQAHQAEIISRMLEDYPHKIDGSEIEAIASLLARLTGYVAAYLIEELAVKEGKI
ncbi:hypothetical protein [Pectobacterium sp. CHL-2024]|uniref:hypothetical protein n=1 Tax=Pectobacterium sp. CHL-2024 TaxID=3377079 RepID=UPI00380AF39D